MEPKGVVCETYVLVVDDNEDIREIVTIMLSHTGYRCDSARNGTEALQRIRVSRFDAVITDVEMPEMDGIALTKELSKHYSDLPVMIMTSHSDDDHKAIAFQAGAREFLSKPFAVPDLIAKLHRMLPGHNLTKEQEVPKRA
jgi:CheY-like chemotaxis protein